MIEKMKQPYTETARFWYRVVVFVINQSIVVIF